MSSVVINVGSDRKRGAGRDGAGRGGAGQGGVGLVWAVRGSAGQRLQWQEDRALQQYPKCCNNRTE